MAATGPLVSVDDLRAVLGPVSADDAQLQQVCSAADGTLLPLLRDGDWSLNPNCREAALAIAVQIWQARHSPGGQMVTMDFGTMTSPHLLGTGLVKRVQGLVGPYLQNAGLNFA